MTHKNLQMDKEKKIKKERGDAFIHISITNSLNKVEEITLAVEIQSIMGA